MLDPNLPSLFVTYGPNTTLGGASIMYRLEASARHMRQAIDRLTAGKFKTVEVTEADDAAYDREIQDLLDVSVWSHCENWYRHPSGRITSNWPGATLPFARRTKVLDPHAFSWA